MKKAVLVVNMPKTCEECVVCTFDGYCMKTGEFCSERDKKKQDNCPLVPMPEKKRTIEETGKDKLFYNAGWNDCRKGLERKVKK